jgi:hypothetical protein
LKREWKTFVMIFGKSDSRGCISNGSDALGDKSRCSGKFGVIKAAASMSSWELSKLKGRMRDIWGA